MPAGEQRAGGSRQEPLTGNRHRRRWRAAAATAIGAVAAVAWQASARSHTSPGSARRRCRPAAHHNRASRYAPRWWPSLRARCPSRSTFSPSDGIPRNSFVRFRGLPPTASLSEGHSIAPGAWAVPLNGLPRLTLILPATASGKSELIVSLVGEDGALLAEARVLLVILPAGPLAPVDKGAKAAEPPPLAGRPARRRRNARTRKVGGTRRARSRAGQHRPGPSILSPRRAGWIGARCLHAGDHIRPARAGTPGRSGHSGEPGRSPQMVRARRRAWLCRSGRKAGDPGRQLS